MEDSEMRERYLRSIRQDALGREVPDPQPVAVPAGFKAPESLQDQIRRLIRSEQFQRDLADAGVETFEEAEDFEIDDDMFDPSSPYEEVFDPVLGRGITLQEFRDNEAIYHERFLKAEIEAEKVMTASEALRAKRRDAARPKEKREAAEGAAPSSSPPAKPQA